MRLDGESVSMLQSQPGKSLAHRSFVYRMHIQAIAMIVGYRHRRMGNGLCQQALRMTERRPRRARQAAELGKIERKFGSLEVITPTPYKGFEENFVQLYIVRIALPLIPDDTIHRIMVKRGDSSTEKVRRFIRMAALSSAVGHRTALRPRLYIIIGTPVDQQFGHHLLQRVHIHPRPSGGSTHCILDDSHRQVERVAQLSGEVIGHRRQLPGVGCIHCLPHCRTEILETVDSIHLLGIPTAVVGHEPWLHGEESQLGICRIGNGLCALRILSQGKSHIRLPACNPYHTCQNIVEYQHILAIGHPERVRLAGKERWYRHLPPATVRSLCTIGMPVDSDRDTGMGIRLAMQGEVSAMRQHHARRVYG